MTNLENQAQYQPFSKFFFACLLRGFDLNRVLQQGHLASAM
ncbi:hypothetical protein [Nitrosopumilus sp.]|nr:hypothetical protein [Nitrosopumilus sp.]